MLPRSEAPAYISRQRTHSSLCAEFPCPICYVGTYTPSLSEYVVGNLRSLVPNVHRFVFSYVIINIVSNVYNDGSLSTTESIVDATLTRPTDHRITLTPSIYPCWWSKSFSTTWFIIAFSANLNFVSYGLHSFSPVNWIHLHDRFSSFDGSLVGIYDMQSCMLNGIVTPSSWW